VQFGPLPVLSRHVQYIFVMAISKREPGPKVTLKVMTRTVKSFEDLFSCRMAEKWKMNDGLRVALSIMNVLNDELRNSAVIHVMVIR
jgi:hypothetical protein